MFSFSPQLVTEPWPPFLFRLSNRKFHLFSEVVNLAKERHLAACLEMVAANLMQDKHWTKPLAKKTLVELTWPSPKPPQACQLANAYVMW
jgi:hypothetical protein